MEKKGDDLKSVYKDIRWRINKMYDKRREFFSHLIAFAFSMFVLWNILMPRGAWVNYGKAFSILWTMGLLIHFIDWIFEEFKERAIMNELRRMGVISAEEERIEKLKRSERFVRLSDDGELIEMDDPHQTEDQPWRQNGNRSDSRNEKTFL